MSHQADQLDEEIRQAKSLLRDQTGDVRAALANIERAIKPGIDAVVRQGSAAIPDMDFADISSGKISEKEKDRIRDSGCLVVRGVFPQHQVRAWNNEIREYITTNNYQDKTASRAGLDKYFSTLSSGKPQIFGVYWSRPQMQARQSAEMAGLRRWLNSLWHLTAHQPEFDPQRECLYADRVRMRRPGDATLGLSPHIDGGSVERWIDQGYRKVYSRLFSKNPQEYQPFSAAWRTETREIPSPAVCSMFRTYQGWTALTSQGAKDGTLHLVPVSRALGWILLRALQEDVEDTDLCGAKAGRALEVSSRHHGWLLDAYVPVPQVEPGDTVWWHPDLIHGVGDEHQGTGYSNVIYIGAAPYCAKNSGYLRKQRQCFEEGRSAPDFAPEDYEVDFAGRFTAQELSPLGRMQMGYEDQQGAG